MNKPIISIWGFGPSYRRRVKLNILEALQSGYDVDKMMDYVILTDYPDDFNDLLSTNKIKAVVNVHDVRLKHTWSISKEPIPSAATDEKAYGEEYKRNMSEHKFFNYSLHRFSLPTIAELGYTKIVMIDGDVRIKYSEIGKTITEDAFWREFETPMNSMKACHKETIKIYNSPDGYKIQPACAVGYDNSTTALQMASIMTHKLMEKYGYNHLTPAITNLDITEGPFKYFNFESPTKVMAFFNAWNSNVEVSLTSYHHIICETCGGYMLCDYLPVAAANYYNKMQVLDFPKTVYSVRIIYEDRYFLPPIIAGRSKYFEVAETQEEFFKKNEEIITVLKNEKAWPNVD